MIHHVSLACSAAHIWDLQVCFPAVLDHLFDSQTHFSFQTPIFSPQLQKKSLSHAFCVTSTALKEF